MDRPPAPVSGDDNATVEGGTVGLAGESVVGLISLIHAHDSLLIENVVVDPSPQGTGCGLRLMDLAEQEAPRPQLGRLILYTIDSMVANLATGVHLGNVEVERRTEEAYRWVFMEKLLLDHRLYEREHTDRECRPVGQSWSATRAPESCSRRPLEPARPGRRPPLRDRPSHPRWELDVVANVTF